MADILNMESPLVNTVVKEIIILTGGMDTVRHKAGNPQGRIPVAREREEAKGGPTPEDKSAVVLSQVIYDACVQSSQLCGQASLPLVS